MATAVLQSCIYDLLETQERLILYFYHFFILINLITHISFINLFLNTEQIDVTEVYQCFSKYLNVT